MCLDHITDFWSAHEITHNESQAENQYAIQCFVFSQGYGGGTGRLDDFYSFTFDTNKWEKVEVLSDIKPGCRENNGVVIGDSSRMYLFGGYNGSTWLNDLWMFDIDTQKWTCIQESSESSNTTVLAGAAVPIPIPARLDEESPSSSALVQALQRMATQRTSAVMGVVPTHRFGYVSVVHNNKFVLFGGFDGVRWLNDMYEFDLQTNVWKRIEARGNLPSVRSCPAWAKDDRYVYIHGVS